MQRNSPFNQTNSFKQTNISCTHETLWEPLNKFTGSSVELIKHYLKKKLNLSNDELAGESCFRIPLVGSGSSCLLLLSSKASSYIVVIP
jgi:hypothetical protein